MIGLAITMYDEHNLVAQSISNIIKAFGEQAIIVVAHSDDKCYTHDLEFIKSNVSAYILLPDLGLLYHHYIVPARAMTRNQSRAFSKLYELSEEYDYLVGFNGDTLLTDATNFQRRFRDMKSGGWLAMVSQAIGQTFQSADSTLETALSGETTTRYQHEMTTDFIPNLFILDGPWAVSNKLFSDIELVNEFSAEHCFGNELAKQFKSEEDFHKKVRRLNFFNPSNCYSYSDGVIYNARTGGRPGR